MATSGYYGFKIDNKLTFTYKHSDSYPEYLGENLLCEIFNFLNPVSINFLEEIIYLQKECNKVKNNIASEKLDSHLREARRAYLILLESHNYETKIRKMKDIFKSLKPIKEDYELTKAEIQDHKCFFNEFVGSKNIKDVYCLLWHLQGNFKRYFDKEAYLIIDYSEYDFYDIDYSYLIDFDNNKFKIYRDRELFLEYSLYKLPIVSEFSKDVKNRNKELGIW